MMSSPSQSAGGQWRWALAGAALTLTAACEASAAPKVHTIVVSEMQFAPKVASLRAGDSVLWVNKGMLRHTATARDKSFNVDLPPQASRKVVIRSPGTVSFTCVYHPAMKGVLNAAK